MDWTASETTPATPAADSDAPKEVKDEDVEMEEATAIDQKGKDANTGTEGANKQEDDKGEVGKDSSKNGKAKVDEKSTANAPPVEIIDVDELDSKLPPAGGQAPLQAASSVRPGAFDIDVSFEASKLPLDVAIFNSARAAGGDEKIRKYLQAVLVIGGSALIPGMAHALESRFVSFPFFHYGR